EGVVEPAEPPRDDPRHPVARDQPGERESHDAGGHRPDHREDERDGPRPYQGRGDDECGAGYAEGLERGVGRDVPDLAPDAEPHEGPRRPRRLPELVERTEPPGSDEHPDDQDDRHDLQPGERACIERHGIFVARGPPLGRRWSPPSSSCRWSRARPGAVARGRWRRAGTASLSSRGRRGCGSSDARPPEPGSPAGVRAARGRVIAVRRAARGRVVAARRPARGDEQPSRRRGPGLDLETAAAEERLELRRRPAPYRAGGDDRRTTVDAVLVATDELSLPGGAPRPFEDAHG